MGWDVPWYAAQDSTDVLLAGHRFAILGVLPVREIATRVSDYDNVGPIACIHVDCRCGVDINGGTGVRRIRCDHAVSMARR